MRQGELIVNPTLACGNPLNFKKDLDILENTGIKILHIDIMDGHYVPNLCFDTGMVVLNPAQSPELLRETLPYLDFVLVMGVEPGFSGQRFLEGTVEKVSRLRDMREQLGLSYLIEADGGVDRENTVTLLENGADILVSGAFGVFEGRNGLEQDCKEYQELALRAAGER